MSRTFTDKPKITEHALAEIARALTAAQIPEITGTVPKLTFPQMRTANEEAVKNQALGASGDIAKVDYPVIVSTGSNTKKGIGKSFLEETVRELNNSPDAFTKHCGPAFHYLAGKIRVNAVFGGKVDPSNDDAGAVWKVEYSWSLGDLVGDVFETVKSDLAAIRETKKRHREDENDNDPIVVDDAPIVEMVDTETKNVDSDAPIVETDGLTEIHSQQ